jgi:hypothetical protein
MLSVAILQLFWQVVGTSVNDRDVEDDAGSMGGEDDMGSTGNGEDDVLLGMLGGGRTLVPFNLLV